MSRGRRRERGQMAEISISFLDVISCGFGAIVLLLLIAKTVESTAFEQSANPLKSSVAELQHQLFEIRGETTILNHDLISKQEQLSDIELRIARLQSELASVRRQRDAVAQVDTTEHDKLSLALQVLTEEMKRLLAQQNRPDRQLVGGIPVDSEYIIFYRRHLRQHVQLCLAAVTPGNAPHPRYLSQGKRHSGDERHGWLYVYQLSRQMDSRYPGTPQSHH